MVHADVKPSNVMVDDDGNSVLVDYGNALKTDHLQAYYDTWELQSPLYRAPEIFLHQQPLTLKIDWWSLGILLLELAHGSHPFEGCQDMGGLIQATFDLLGPLTRLKHELIEDQSLLLDGLSVDDMAGLRLYNLAKFTGLHDTHWLSFLDGLLKCDADERFDGPELLKHSFLAPMSPALQHLLLP